MGKEFLGVYSLRSAPYCCMPMEGLWNMRDDDFVWLRYLLCVPWGDFERLWRFTICCVIG